MIYIYKTSHLLQHNSRKAPNTQFKVDKLRQLEGSKHNLYRNGSTTKGHFHQDYNYSRKCPSCPDRRFRTRARFLSLSQTVLRNCLSQDSSETGLRSLVVSVFYLCLRQKIVLQIQIQVLVNTLSPIKYLFFLKNPVIKRNFIFTKRILILRNYCSIIEP